MSLACPACGTENEPGRKFCLECGGTLSIICAACGAANAPVAKFCGECGRALVEVVASVAPAAERRHLSVLFADLVGFTTLSEQRDAEDVRELLSRYFDTCRRLIELYGGTVEKFIGDAVMAVWGTPTAQEDDAERAVRGALDLIAAVSALGQEVGAPELRARAGVLTGEAAVTLGGAGEGMVAGDVVNTASRIQAVADPGTVLVGESTRRATEAAIAYAEAGTHELKGKAEPVPLWRALRVTAGRKGALKSAGPEPPFVGRERELRLVKELFHASAEEHKAHLVSVVGIAGIGKSRLTWEFFKYIDGLVDTVWWHRGRCLAYGEGVAYWALAEMVRMRATIVEGEQPDAARAKLGQALELHVPDAEERAWIEPRLAHLLGLEERTSGEREDLFAAWRLFFERMAEQNPTVLVFEDMQWADASLLEFIDYLLEWSRNHPLYVLALARPELVDRHTGFGVGGRNATTLSLEPLPAQAMEELLAGFVPGLPDELRTSILQRAEGVPLYAVETVRMLLDRGLLAREGDEYRPTGPIAELDVPETLHALIAARLDGLGAEERRLIQDASVLGKTFTKDALATVSGIAEDELGRLLASLVRKEVLSLQADPRSPERGQYGFLQDLLKRVAYETLSRRERKARHLTVARYLEQTWGTAEQEIVEVLASHYLDAYNAAPSAPDAADIRGYARDALARAGERAASLAASEEALRYFEQAVELVDEPLIEANLRERAGDMARSSGRLEEATAHFGRAITLLEEAGFTHPAARVSARLGEAIWRKGDIAAAVERMERSFEILAGDQPDADLAALAAQIARLRSFMGDRKRAAEMIDLALTIAESLRVPELIAESLNTKALVLSRLRPEEAIGVLRQALSIGIEHDLTASTLRSYNNLGYFASQRDRYDECLEYTERALELARRRGDRQSEWWLLAALTELHGFAGDWDRAFACAAEIPQGGQPRLHASPSLVRMYVERGQLDEAERVLAATSAGQTSDDLQDRAISALTRAIVLRARGSYREAIEAAAEAFAAWRSQGGNVQGDIDGLIEACEAAFALDDLAKVEELLAEHERWAPVERTQHLEAHRWRFKARLAARDDAEAAERGFKQAGALFRELAMPFWLAVAQLEYAEWLAAHGRRGEAEGLTAEARVTFELLETRPWLERATRVGQLVPA